MENHQDPGPQDGQAAPDPRLRRGDQLGHHPDPGATSACRSRPRTASPPRSWVSASQEPAFAEVRRDERIVWAWILTIRGRRLCVSDPKAVRDVRLDLIATPAVHEKARRPPAGFFMGKEFFRTQRVDQGRHLPEQNQGQSPLPNNGSTPCRPTVGTTNNARKLSKAGWVGSAERHGWRSTRHAGAVFAVPACPSHPAIPRNQAFAVAAAVAVAVDPAVPGRRPGRHHHQLRWNSAFTSFRNAA